MRQRPGDLATMVGERAANAILVSVSTGLAMSAPAGANTLIDATNGSTFPAVPARALLRTSQALGWRGILVEWHRLPPDELRPHYVTGHGISISTCVQPIPFGWRGRRGWEDRIINPGGSHLLTQGELNTPRWLQPFDGLSLVLDPQFVADVVREHLPPNAIEFVSQRSVDDPILSEYGQAFQREMSADSPLGAIYVDALTIGLVLHLLATYGVARPKVPAPRSKLNSYQLRSVVAFIESHLDEDVSVITLARRAHVSPFHFARLFRQTVGLPPHQFVLRLRMRRAIALAKGGQYSLAQIAAECGFHDQAHLTHAFRRVLGTTPSGYLGRR
jgi:AraC family transcriptional regulator